MKKWFTMILTVVIMASMVGCQNSVKTSNKSDGVPTLVWYVPGDKQADMPAVMEEANKISVEKIGAKLDLQFIDAGAYSERMTMNMASGKDYDLCFTGYINNYAQAVKKGGLLSMDKYLDEMPTLKASLPDYMWDAATVEGSIYAVPNMQNMAFTLCAYTFKDLADKYGLDPASVHKAEDLDSYLQKIKQNEPDLIPFRTHWGEDSFTPQGLMKEDILPGVVALFNNDGSIKVMPRVKADYYKTEVQTMRDWYEKGYVRQDVASVVDDSSDFNMGRYAVWVEGYKPGTLAEYQELFGRECVAMQLLESRVDRSMPTQTMTGIGRNSKNPELAMKMIELVNTDKDFYNLICNGIENKHYKKVGANRIEFIKDSGYAPRADWKFGNQFNAFIIPGQSDDVWEQTKRINDEATKSPLLGFNLDMTPIQNEISQIQTVLSQYKATQNGSSDPSTYYDEMVKRLDDGGMDKIVAEVQKQIDEWQTK